MNIEEFITERILKVLAIINGSENSTFVILPELGAKKKSLSTLEDMANWWVLPYWTNRELTFKEVVASIQFFDSISPLWIKVSRIKNNELIGLELSQKLRKRKEILQHHSNDELAPFIICNPYLDFSYSEKRTGLLNYLTLKLSSTSYLKDYFKNNPPTKEEIKKCIHDNFESSYVYFPNNYTHRNPGDEGYTECLIKYDSTANYYEILSREDQVIMRSKSSDEIFNKFITDELKCAIGEIRIKNCP
jgi:hypothetical protein